MEVNEQYRVDPSKLTGRRPIYTDAVSIDASNVVEELNRALVVHNVNRAEIRYLYDYYRGKQPILRRVKDIRPEINNKIVENHAQEVVSFKTGYLLGEPCTYVRRGEDDQTSGEVKKLNEVMFSAGKAACDRELADWLHICGVGYRMVLPVKSGAVELDCMNPRYTFVMRNGGFGKRPLMGVHYLYRRGGCPLYCVYTVSRYFEIENGRIVNGGGQGEAHSLGAIPIIEYQANTARLGAFEIVLPLLDALNNATSNRMDGVEQFVQSFVKFINCDIDKETFRELQQMGAIKVKSVDGQTADVDIVTNELNQQQTQVLVDYLYNQVLAICGLPSTQSGGSSTSDTGAAVILRDGWQQAEARARDTEMMFKKSERDFLALTIRVLRDKMDLNLELSDVDVKFTRRQHDNLLVKSQSLQNMLEAGISPEVAIAQCGLFNDPQDVYAQSKEYLEKWKPAVADKTIREDVKPQNVGDDDKRKKEIENGPESTAG